METTGAIDSLKEEDGPHSSIASNGGVGRVGEQAESPTEGQGDDPEECMETQPDARTNSSSDDQTSEECPSDSGGMGGEEEAGVEDDIGDTEFLDGVERNQLYQRGLEHEAAGEKRRALRCFLGCLKGLKTDTQFTLLPQCLNSIGTIYGDFQEYDKAICFKQAEKLYYENALVDSTEIQKRLEGMQLSGEESAADTTEDLRRAGEYEHLARLLLDKDEPQHALEYAAKATKIRQKELGNDDPLTQETLNFFASVYAEVGKKQYAESLKDLQEDISANSSSALNEGRSETSPSSILRHRRGSRNKEKKQVRFDESANQELVTETEGQIRQPRGDYASYWCVWLIFVVCSAGLLMLGMYLYCRLVPSDRSCRDFVRDVHAFLTRLRMYYYYYVGPRPSKAAYAR